MEERNLTLEEKVDLLLEFQKKSQRYALARLILSILIFVFLVILPIWGVLWIEEKIRAYIQLNPESLKEGLEGVRGLLNLDAS